MSRSTRIPTVLLSLACALGQAGAQSPAKAAPSNSDSAPVRFVLVVTGSELLEGIYGDIHTQYITRTLTPLGAHCEFSLSVGDRREDLLRALRFALDNAPLAIVTGGLGPTDADITREVLSEFTSIPLQENRAIVEELERRFNVKSGGLNPNTQRQARVPTKGTFLPNAQGTAVGLVFDNDRGVIVALPGPPDELQPMVSERLVPYLEGRFGIRSIGTSLQMRFVGIGESALTQTIHDHLELTPDLIVSFKFESGRVDVTFGLPGNRPEDAARLKEFEGKLLSHVGEYLYSDDGSSLEERVLRSLSERHLTLAIAEIGSYGAVAESLSGASPGIRLAGENARPGPVLVGSLTAPDTARLAALLGASAANIGPASAEDDARLLAQRVREFLGTGCGIGVSQRFSPADGSEYIWAALSIADSEPVVRRIPVRANLQTSRRRMVTDILDFLRRELARQQ